MIDFDHCLVDTSVVARRTQSGSTQYPAAERSLTCLFMHGVRLYLAEQTLYEFWVVATRPPGDNGFGYTTNEAAVAIRNLQNAYTILRSESYYDEWYDLVIRYHVSGKAAHDARFVALMLTCGLTYLLTFNINHFVRYSEIVVINPEDYR